MTSGTDEGSAMEQLMTISRSVVRNCLVVHVRGEVESMTAHRLTAAVGEALAEALGRLVVVDLADVSFLDSAGLDALVRITEEGEYRGGPLRLVVDEQRPVVRPIQLAGLEHRLALYHSVGDATAHPA
jgi:anti-sigma B factor antagonist